MKKLRIFPSRFINFFVITLLNFGIIAGSIFLFLTKNSDRLVVMDKLRVYFNAVFSSQVSFSLAFRNVFFVDLMFIIIILFGVIMFRPYDNSVKYVFDYTIEAFQIKTFV